MSTHPASSTCTDGHDPPAAKHLARPSVPIWGVVACAMIGAMALVFHARHPSTRTGRPWPGYSHAQRDAGHVMLRMGRVEEALSHCRKSVELWPESASAHNNLGNALLAAERLDEAKEQYAEAVRLEPEFADAHHNLGNIWLQQGNPVEAQAKFETTVILQPAHADAHYNLGFLHLSAGRLEKAEEHYAMAARLRPAHAATHSSRGLVLLQLGRTREAVAEFEEALKHDARLLSALNNLAWILATAPDPGVRHGPRAMELARRAAEASGGANPGVLKTLAAAHAETGQMPEALEAARRAMQLAQEQGAAGLRVALEECIRMFESGQACRDPGIR